MDARIQFRHGLIPFGMLLVTMPLWLGLGEPEVFYFFNRHLAVLPDDFWAAMSLLGTGWAVYALTATALWRAPHIILSWLCAAPIAGVLTRLGKSLANTPRPLEVLDASTVHLIGEPLYIAAMPSGHTMTGFAAATAIWFALKRPKAWMGLGLFGLAVLVGLSRMAVGAHWPADVSVGAAAGVFSGMAGAWLSRRWLSPHTAVRSWLMRGVALFGLYCAHVLWNDPMGFVQNQWLQQWLTALLLLSLLWFARLSGSPVKPSV